MKFELLCTSPNSIKVVALACRTGLRERPLTVTVVTAETLDLLMPCQRDRALVTAKTVPTRETSDSMTEAPPIEKENRLLSALKAYPDRCEECAREIARLWMWAAATAHINELKSRELCTCWAALHREPLELPSLAVKDALE